MIYHVFYHERLQYLLELRGGGGREITHAHRLVIRLDVQLLTL